MAVIEDIAVLDEALAAIDGLTATKAYHKINAMGGGNQEVGSYGEGRFSRKCYGIMYAAHAVGMAKTARCCRCQKPSKIKIRPNFINTTASNLSTSSADCLKQVRAFLASGSKAYGVCTNCSPVLMDVLEEAFGR